jgi:hypothetical protein
MGRRLFGDSSRLAGRLPVEESFTQEWGFPTGDTMDVQEVEKPEHLNVIVGQTHFIKTAEDLYEALVNSVPGIQFGLSFCEASGPCLTRTEAPTKRSIAPKKEAEASERRGVLRNLGSKR